MKAAVMTFTLLAFAGSALALTYTWEDEQGTVNFAEDAGKIPKKYRKKAKILGAGEEEQPTATETERKVEIRSVPMPDLKETPKAAESPKGSEYGGKTPTAWKNDFGRLSADLKAAEDQVVDLRTRLKETAGMSRSEYLSLQMSIKNIESRVLELRKKKDLLNEAANKAGVPDDLR